MSGQRHGGIQAFYRWLLGRESAAIPQVTSFSASTSSSLRVQRTKTTLNGHCEVMHQVHDNFTKAKSNLQHELDKLHKALW